MTIEIINRQNVSPANPKRLVALTRHILSQAVQAEESRFTNIDVVLLDDLGIARVNQRCFQKDTVTDVISLTYAPAPGMEDRTAEIFINVQRCLDLGPRHGGADRELALYIAHGCNHITGGRDDEPATRRQMRRRDSLWLARAVEAGLTNHLLTPEAH